MKTINPDFLENFLVAYKNMLDEIEKVNKGKIYPGDISCSKESVLEGIHYLHEYLGKRDEIYNIKI